GSGARRRGVFEPEKNRRAAHRPAREFEHHAQFPSGPETPRHGLAAARRSGLDRIDRALRRKRRGLRGERRTLESRARTGRARAASGGVHADDNGLAVARRADAAGASGDRRSPALLARDLARLGERGSRLEVIVATSASESMAPPLAGARRYAAVSGGIGTSR